MDDDTTISLVSSNEVAPNLATLPLELRIKIFRYLRPSTRFLPKTVVTKLKEEDDRGIWDLLILCVTSSRLLEAARPLLYEAINIVGRPYYSDDEDDKDEEELKGADSDDDDISACMIRQLTCLLRTLSIHPHLAKYIKQIRSIYHLGRQTQGCRWTTNAMRKAIDAGQPAMVERLSNPHTADLWTKKFNDTPAQAQIMLLLWLCPNVSELALYSYDGPLSRILGLELSPNVPNFHNYARLATINLDNFHGEGIEKHPDFPEPETYDTCISTLDALPALRHFRHDTPMDVMGVLQAGVERIPFNGEMLSKLTTLHLIDCQISMGQVLRTVRPCRVLSDFRFRACAMAINRTDEDEITHLDFAGICKALVQSKETLRYLCLSMGSGVHQVGNVGTYNTLAAGTLEEFDKLKTLVVPAAILTETSEKIDPGDFHFDDVDLQIIHSLPSSVVFLGLSNDQIGRFHGNHNHRWLAREAAAQLARDLARLPNLQAVHILQPRPDVEYPNELHICCAQDEIELVIEETLVDDEIMMKHYGITK